MSSSTRTVVQVLGTIREDLRVHRNDVFSPGWRALVVYRAERACATNHRGPPQLATPLIRLVHRRVRRRFGIDIDPRADIGRRLHIAHQGGIRIGPGAVIGDDCLVRHRVTIDAREGSEGAPRLGDRVHIGVGARVLGSISIGDDARVGPNTALHRDVPAASAALVPASEIRRPVGSSSRPGGEPPGRHRW
jgi:serine O-acetyltransferase